MHTVGEYVGAQRSLKGELILSFEVADETAMDELKECERYSIDVKKYKQARSGEANRYFWHLVDEIAKKMHADRLDIYIIRLRHDGVFIDVRVSADQFDSLKEQFRWVEVFDDGHLDIDSDDSIWARCYVGSSHYNTEEMARLIDGTVEEAKMLGIDTMTPDELEQMISAWRPNRRI